MSKPVTCHTVGNNVTSNLDPIQVSSASRGARTVSVDTSESNLVSFGQVSRWSQAVLGNDVSRRIGYRAGYGVPREPRRAQPDSRHGAPRYTRAQ